jgi:hypothetical protein
MGHHIGQSPQQGYCGHRSSHGPRSLLHSDSLHLTTVFPFTRVLMTAPVGAGLADVRFVLDQADLFQDVCILDGPAGF